MQPNTIVEYLNVFKYRQAGIRSALETGTINQFSFQGFEKRFDTGVVVTVALSAPAGRDAEIFKIPLVIKAGILLTLI